MKRPQSSVHGEQSGAELLTQKCLLMWSLYQRHFLNTVSRRNAAAQD